LCSSGFLLVVVVRFVGLAVLDGIAVGLAMGVVVNLAVGCGCGAWVFFAWVAR